MKIAVLITCHNRKDVTVACLRRLLPQMGKKDSVFLVDDGSSDGTGEAVKGIADERITVVNGDGSLYWAIGMRLAWETAVNVSSYDCYLWLNDDLMLKKDAIASLLADYKIVKSVVVGVCSEDDTETKVSYGATDASDKFLEPIGMPRRADGWLNGNLVLVPKDVFESIGMISCEYTHARADYDYAERLKAKGVPFYCSSNFVGVCRNDFGDKVNHLSLCERVKLLWKPGYFNLHDLWIIRKKYHGNLRAIVSCVHMVIIVFRGRW